MSYTDMELSKLKYALENPAPNWFDKDNLAGLVARLEAAEDVIKRHMKTNSCCWGNNPCPSTNAWRKAAGK